MVYQYGNLDLEVNLKIFLISELCVWERINQPGMAMIQGFMEEKEHIDVMLLDDEEIIIKNHSDNYKFVGNICSVKVERESHFYSFCFYAKSAAYKMNSIKRKRVFQDLEMTYNEVIKEVLVPYVGSSYIDTVTDGMKIPHMMIQYNETDWDFLKRLSSHFNEGLCEDCQAENIQLFFGFPKQDVTELDGRLEKRCSNVLDKQESVFVSTHRRHQPGERVLYQQKYYYIRAVKLIMVKGEILYQLWMVSNKGQVYPYNANQFIAGARIKAITKGIIRNRIHLQFQIEDHHIENAPYIPYAGEVNNEDGFYMPDIGDIVDVYFPDAEEESALVVSAGRILKETGEDLDCTMKYLGNKEQIQLYMDKSAVGFSAGKNGGEIQMKTKGALMINAPETLRIEAGRNLEVGGRDNRVSLYAEKKVCLNAGTLQKASVTLEESGNIVCKSSRSVLYRRNEEIKSMFHHVDTKSAIDVHEARNIGMALSGVEFLSQAITGTSDFENSRKIMNSFLGQTSHESDGEGRTQQSGYNPIKEELFQSNERLFNSFSYGENKNG